MEKLKDKIIELYDLKDEIRAHSEIFRSKEPESVADHTWGVALLTLIYGEKTDLDLERMLKMALLHDLAEAKIGDIAYRVQKSARKNKAEKEEEEWQKISEHLGKDLENLWSEYEERETEEAQFVKDMDLLDLAIQALRNEEMGKYDRENADSEFEHQDEIFKSVENRLNHEDSREIFEDIKKKYEKAKNE